MEGSSTVTGEKRRAGALDRAVLGQRGSADHPQLAAGEHRLEHVRGVHRALGAAGAEHHVQLVDEQDDPALGRRDLRQRGLEALLELAAVLAAGQHAREVERHDARAAERLGDIVLRDAQGQALHDRGLADAGLADQHGVVLAPAGEDLDGLLDLVRTPDDGVDAPGRRLGGQVTAELVERRGLRAAVLLRLLRHGLAEQLRCAGVAQRGGTPAAGAAEHDPDGAGAEAAVRAHVHVLHRRGLQISVGDTEISSHVTTQSDDGHRMR
jgi:hypothetical protein